MMSVPTASITPIHCAIACLEHGYCQSFSWTAGVQCRISECLNPNLLNNGNLSERLYVEKGLTANLLLARGTIQNFYLKKQMRHVVNINQHKNLT